MKKYRLVVSGKALSLAVHKLSTKDISRLKEFQQENSIEDWSGIEYDIETLIDGIYLPNETNHLSIYHPLEWSIAVHDKNDERILSVDQYDVDIHDDSETIMVDEIPGPKAIFLETFQGELMRFEFYSNTIPSAADFKYDEIILQDGFKYELLKNLYFEGKKMKGELGEVDSIGLTTKIFYQ